LVALAFTVWVLIADVGWQSPVVPAASPPYRVAFWNSAGRTRGWEAASQEIDAFDADIIGIAECENSRPEDRAYWSRRFPDHTVDLPQPGLAFLVRGKILDRGHMPLGLRSHARWYDVELDGRRCRLVLVDIASQLLQPRGPLFAKLGALIESSGDRPVLVLGDFNTPCDAPSLAPLRMAGLRHVRGRGYRPTWPVPFPVLTLDQIWTSPHWTVVDGNAGWSWRSDHRPVFADLELGARR
jgi:vancomycin resistance protein VanJ